jgi:hypothetical protein
MAHAPERTINRYYDPTTDQFLSVDPDVATTEQTYVFTNDDPLNASDPLGEDDAGWQFVQECDASPACNDAPFTWPEGLAIVVNGLDLFGPDEIGFGEIADAGADDFAANSEAADSEDSGASNELPHSGSPAEDPSNANMAVRDYIAKYLKGSVNRQMPSEFLNMTLKQALKTGSSTVRKLLTNGDYLKGSKK